LRAEEVKANVKTDKARRIAQVSTGKTFEEGRKATYSDRGDVRDRSQDRNRAEVVTGVLIEETAATIIEAGVKTASIGTTMDAVRRKTIVGPAMAAPETIVAVNHATEEEDTNEEEKIADEATHQRIFGATILRGEIMKILLGVGAIIEGGADPSDQTTARKKVKMQISNG
jgi:hypothetical protein